MVDRYLDQQVETMINDWLETDGQSITEQMTVLFDGVNDGQARFEIDEKSIKLFIDMTNACPCEVETSSQNSKVLEFIQKVNEKFIMREIPKLQDGLKFMLKTFAQTVLGIIINQVTPKKDTPMDEVDDMFYDCQQNSNNMDYGNECAQVEDSWGINGQQDQEMQQNQDDDDDAVDWGLDDQDDDRAVDYTQQIQININQDKINEIKQLGVVDPTQASMMSGVLNFKSVRLFEQSKLFKEALEAQEYLQQNQNNIEGWLNLVVTKEFLNLRIEIDLNYINLHPSNITMLGWKIEEPLIIVLDISEPKILNTLEKDLNELDFKNMWQQGMIQFQSINAASQHSFGCNDYMREVFKTFITECLTSKRMNNDFLQEEKKEMIQDNIKSKAKSLWKKMFGQKEVDDEKLSQLLNMGFEIKLAKKSLLECGNDLEKAIDIMNELEINGVDDHELPLLKKQISKDYSIRNLPHTKNQLIRMMLYICDRLDKSTQFCILCHTPLEIESIKLRACTSDHCEFIFEENFGGTIFPELKFNQQEAFLNISLAAKALFSQRAGQVFEPFPTFFLKNTEMRTKRGNLDVIQRAKVLGSQGVKEKMVSEANKDLAKMTELFQKIPPYAQLMKDVNSEEDLRKKLNTLYKDEKMAWTAYKMLSYVLATNRSTFVKLTQENIVDLRPGAIMGQNQNVDEINNYFEQYLIIPQDQAKERIFRQRKKQHGSVFCWHGSSTENWYSILRNGLRNVSNTTLMTAGAAYGAGIYASSQFSTSYGYTARYTAGNKHWPHANQWIGQYFIIAVCEIVKKKEYDKNSNFGIAVIPDEDDIVIRYLFMIKNHQMYGIPNIDTFKIDFEKHYYSQLRQINTQLATQRIERIKEAFTKFQDRRLKQQEELKKIQEQTFEKILKAEEEELEQQFRQMAEKFTGKGSQLSTQRISKDYVGLMKSSEFKDKIKVEFFKNNMYIWKVSFDIVNYEVSNELKSDFKKLAQQIGEDKATLQYEIIFSDKYPIEPPFVRVVFPRFAFRTGHVTVGGSICIESLTPSGWSSARSLESYFVEIVSLINAGNARLDLNTMQPYSLHEAKDAFNRVARDHGWLK